ncbi:MAG: hydrolase 2, exosortase A system-associated [Azonexus sp.]|jgi:exosortase A-associated hydrolase 2|uniref:hydrolase 2, exosortase A system-associated n=1 Tax=Azonexus sp. TaxID=1872668 RepID=UPI00282A8386|nr:hydrolase 2, exosortase A system-associated [Azonexus sp.]MDR0775299.1 hydrolase 2, exosortase A system-associated [Azonexus sp.]
MQPDFLAVGDGRHFCLFHPAQGRKAKVAALYLHPFAEEMNKSRRMAALQSRALAAAGCDVLQIDLLGCGDSSGDFADATWAAWRADVLAAYHYLRQRSAAPLMLWGLRAGCLLAAEAAAELPEAADFLFWQPVVSGKPHWQQFMRLKMAGEMASGQAKAIGEQLRAQLAAGQTVEIAGYEVAPALAAGLEQAELSPPPGCAGRVVWLETSLRDEATLTPAAIKRIEQWRAAGFTVEASVVRGPAFWQTTEIEEAPALLAATRAALAGLA